LKYSGKWLKFSSHLVENLPAYSKQIMRDENGSVASDGNSDRNRLRLVDCSAGQKEEPRLSESAVKELRELIEDIQCRTPRKKQADDDLLPPAA